MTLTFAIALLSAAMSAVSLVLHAVGTKAPAAEKIAEEVDAAGKMLPKL